MVRATLAGLLAHKLRLALTAFAIVLGVSFVAGTYVLTDTLNSTFDRIFAEAYSGVAVTVRGPADPAGDGADARLRLPEALLATVRAVPGVGDAQGFVSENGVTILTRTGGSPGGAGAPTFGIGWVADPISPYHLRSGRAPRGDREIVVDVGTATKQGFHLGDPVTVIIQGAARHSFTLVGLAGFGSSDSLQGATVAAFETATAQRLLEVQGQYNSIAVAAVPGLTDAALRDRISAALPPGLEVITGQDATRQQAQALESQLGFFGTALLIFAGISLFVGSFIIANTFSILVAQRSSELALLRALGATRRQVLVSVLAEALLTGLVASAIGAAAGILIARALMAVLKGFGIDLPADQLVLRPRTVLIALAVGIVVTLLAAILPARRATRVAPVEAMRSGVPVARPLSRRRVGGGAVVTCLGLVPLYIGLFATTGNAVNLVATGAVLVFLGVAILAPLVVAPVARLIGLPLRLVFGVPGKLARENAMRAPRRTASTAAALMIGVALVACVTVIAASFQASVDQALIGAMHADFIVTPHQGGGPPGGYSTAVAETLRQDPHFGSVAELRVGTWLLDGRRQDLLAVDPGAYPRLIGIDAASGDPATLDSRGILISETIARDHNWKVGSLVAMRFPQGPATSQRVAAVFRANALLGDYVVSLSLYQTRYPQQRDIVVLATQAPETTHQAALAALNADLRNFPTLDAADRAQYGKLQSQQIDVVLSLVLVLLALAVVIALLGIVNTLALSIVERTRELGLLRALGLTRWQTRWMVCWESVIIALLGAALGMAIGLALGWALVHSLASAGLGTFAIPVGRLATFVLVAGICGILAAIFPAVRASRLNILSAISTE